MARDKATRAWSARGQYPGKKQFWLGTVVLPLKAQQHEIDEALRALWDEIMPMAPPPTFSAVPGMVIFVPE